MRDAYPLLKYSPISPIAPTWDSSCVDRASGFTKPYKTDYLLPPPEVMDISHVPQDEALQLRSQPISWGKFLPQPMMRVQFFKTFLEG